MMNEKQDHRLDDVEQLLREHGPQELSAEFRRNVMQAIEALPDPELLPPPAPQRDWRWFLSLMGTGEKLGLCLTLLALILAFTPQFQIWLAALNWQWGDMMVSLNLGDVALSASIGTLLAVALGAIVMTGVGIYSSRNHLIGT